MVSTSAWGTRLARRRASDYELVDQRSYVDIAQGAAVRSRRHREVGDDRARCWVLEDERCGESCASELLQPRGEAHRLLRLDTRLHERHIRVDTCPGSATHGTQHAVQVEANRFLNDSSAHLCRGRAGHHLPLRRRHVGQEGWSLVVVSEVHLPLHWHDA